MVWGNGKISRRGLLSVAAGLALASKLPVPLPALNNHYRISCSDNELPEQPVRLTRAPLLKIVTWNVGGLPDLIAYIKGIRTPREVRMPLIGERLAEQNPDLVALQEVFCEEDRERILRVLEGTRLKYSSYSESMWGTGLFTLSAFPIRSGEFIGYREQGSPLNIFHGDWYVGKGVSLSRVEVGKGFELDFYNTHLHSNRCSSDEHRGVRMAQGRELVDYVNGAGNSNQAFLAGDFNFTLGSEEEILLREGIKSKRVLDDRLGKLDHIYAKENLRYSVEIVESGKIDEEIKKRGVVLSDHNGYFSTVQISARMDKEVDFFIKS